MSLVFQLRIDCGNAAFGQDEQEAGQEVARILEDVARQLRDYGSAPAYLRDINGNKVGSCVFLIEE